MRIKTALLLSLCLLLPIAVTAQTKEESRATNAVRVLEEMRKTPDHDIPLSLLEDAEAIAVIPDVVKVGFVVGGRRGKGLLSMRAADGTWSNPAYISMTGGSFGFQAGVQATDVILLFRTRRSIENIVNGKFTLGADAAVAAGPVGRSANAATDEQLKAEIYSYSRSRGLFAGVAIDGAVLAIDHNANEVIYGGSVTPRRILEGRVPPQAEAVIAFRDALEETSQ